MLAFDLPPPAIVIPKPVADWRLHVDGADCGPCLPRDFREMPKALRLSVSADEIRKYLPEPYRLLSDDLIWALVLGNVPALPSAILAGAIKKAWLFTATGNLTIPADFNPNDNAFHAVGKGGNGASAAVSGVFPGQYYAGAGGGGGAWAALFNRAYAIGDVLTATISGDVSFDSSSILLAKAGSNGGSVSGGSSSGGAGGNKASCVGDDKNSGGTAASISGNGSNVSGTPGGGAGGPHGDGLATGSADAGYGGLKGTFLVGQNTTAGGDGVDGPAGGWNPGGETNAGSGGGGERGIGDTAAYRDGKNGGRYGGAGGGSGAGGSGVPNIGTPGTGQQGCVLAINNTSA